MWGEEREAETKLYQAGHLGYLAFLPTAITCYEEKFKLL